MLTLWNASGEHPLNMLTLDQPTSLGSTCTRTASRTKLHQGQPRLHRVGPPDCGLTALRAEPAQAGLARPTRARPHFCGPPVRRVNPVLTRVGPGEGSTRPPDGRTEEWADPPPTGLTRITRVDPGRAWVDPPSAQPAPTRSDRQGGLNPYSVVQP